MYRFITIVLLTIALVRPALAAEPMRHTSAQTVTIEIIDYKSGDTEDLNVSFTDSFRDLAVSVAATVMAMVTEYGSLNILVLVAVSLLALVWLFSVLINRQIGQQITELGDEPGPFDIYGRPKSPDTLKQERADWQAEKSRLQGRQRSLSGDIRGFRQLSRQYWKKERKIRRLR